MITPTQCVQRNFVYDRCFLQHFIIRISINEMAYSIHIISQIRTRAFQYKKMSALKKTKWGSSTESRDLAKRKPLFVAILPTVWPFYCCAVLLLIVQLKRCSNCAELCTLQSNFWLNGSPQANVCCHRPLAVAMSCGAFSLAWML